MGEHTKKEKYTNENLKYKFKILNINRYSIFYLGLVCTDSKPMT
jgi:hypothetical protein